MEGFTKIHLKLLEELPRQDLLLKNCEKVITLVKSVEHDLDRICTSSGHGNNPLKTVGGDKETSLCLPRLTVEKLLKGHNPGKKQSSMTSIKYAHLDKMAKTDKGP